MKIRELTNYLEEIAPLYLQENYDNTGLIIGEEDEEIRAVLTTLDATEEVVEEAMQLDCNLILAHHPIVFHGLKKVNRQHYIGRAIIKAIKNNIAIYAAHTNLDNVLVDGVNQKIADRIGLVQAVILAPKDPQVPNIGSGLIGKLPQAMVADDFFDHLKRQLELSVIKYTTPPTGTMQNVALCGGSGSFLLPRAIGAGADVFISADFKYHEYFEANDKICVIDVGHYESEKFTKDLLLELIQRKFSNFAAYCSKVNTNPINFR